MCGSATPPTGGGNSWLLPAATLGATALGSITQAKMAKDVAKQSEKSYNQYLNTINPPQDVLDARFAQAKDYITGSAPTAQRRLENSLASRGIRGRGATSPISNQNQAVQDALNDAYFNVYTQHNIPSSAAPVVPTPSTGQLFGTNLAQSANYLLPLYWLSQK